MNGSIFQNLANLNLSQNWLKFKKILEKIGNFVQNLAQNWANWYMNGLLFLEKLVFVWVYFQIRGGTKTKLEYPPNVGIGLYWITVGSVIYVIQAWKFSAFPRISDFCVCLRRCYLRPVLTKWVTSCQRTKGDMAHWTFQKSIENEGISQGNNGFWTPNKPTTLTYNTSF